MQITVSTCTYQGPEIEGRYVSCECGCGTYIAEGQEYVELRGRCRWAALNDRHAVKVLRRMTAHPFRAVRLAEPVAEPAVQRLGVQA